ncbi:hypothetical protein D3C71_1946010 [compost metagenome]
MAGFLVSGGVDGHSLDAHLAGSSDDAAGDFATVGDQNFGEHIKLQNLRLRYRTHSITIG